MIHKSLGVLATAGLVLLVGCPSAGAVNPPEVDPQVAPPAGSAGPVAAMTKRSECVTTGVMPGTDPGAVSPNQLALNLSGAWKQSRGQGQTVAVIDTGVQPGPRLPHVEGGGDFIESTDGLTDCDGHGTSVAGLIAGQPGPDGFSGVAPEARLVSIRQNSPRFSPRTPSADAAEARAAADVASLARAVVRAADMGARVINISVVTCMPADKQIDQTELGAALRYAALEKDAVIVAAAGNTQGGVTTGSACGANPLSGTPNDPRNWGGVSSVSIPSWWQPYVLSVGALNATGQPSGFTMAGPWVGIAAPGENISSVSNAPGGGLSNAIPTEQDRLIPLSGTSYATAYVSGVAALVRSKFPDLNARQVVHRLTTTAQGAARSPSNVIGAGGVDPVAALTWDVADMPLDGPVAPAGKPIAVPAEPAPRDNTPRIVAFAGAGALALAAIAWAFFAPRVRAAFAGNPRKEPK
ncbi:MULTISPECIES: type VII secretion-associated serine protease mycosin [unclassified Mycolicibacterium]|uniref:type VII secretion-associated serine protease mycosin n=1 Tax=unclassified Mycolicibacterium TaxID=2636767 RepID=UPI00130996EE|nr:MULTISPECIES: type VII secretion-associated serine protease mycosin [unclassified Mycolicibacterium]MUL82092.1 type VII secretion-associated serine protease mycosin [Mycolicibacterium sp. CBMA 329]MUL87858.1 type VII secretion-associated serine protease mycosin [Mycolicibacterium sp. CBMA 331]MUM01681.1 type VII secretion-associated serine protease mycosin [Mycolicibacterium sp. CBMA 334]MUM28417.1 type VII secretion-associated serine protease mycosin [Mycolicibacterium sp. CBMA 295]MUM3815